MSALTPQLLRARTVALYERTMAVGGPVEEIIFERLVCDGCGRMVNLLAGHPEGWTSSGDLEHGFTDLCRGCSQ